MLRIGLIPARGGSKGIPHKNVALLADKPMIAWTIEAALASSVLDRVIVSTDDEVIAEVARQWGASVPFLRPARLATDTASSIDVVLHTLDYLAHHEPPRPEWVMLLQPTSPLRTAEDIRAAVALQQAREARAVVSVCEAPHPPQWLRRLGLEGELLPWLTDEMPTRRQGIGLVYQLNGAIYLAQTDRLAQERTFFPTGTFGYIMPPERSLDIDAAWDFYLADLILRNRNVAPQL